MFFKRNRFPTSSFERIEPQHSKQFNIEGRGMGVVQGQGFEFEKVTLVVFVNKHNHKTYFYPLFWLIPVCLLPKLYFMPITEKI